MTAGDGSGIAVSAQGTYRRFPVDVQARAAAAMPLVASADATQTVPLRARGRIGRAAFEFDGRAAALLGARAIDGTFSLRGPSLAAVGDPLGITLPTTPPFELSGHIGHLDGVWALYTPQARIGSSRLAGTFRFDTRPEVPLLDGSVHATRLAGADLGPAVGTDAKRTAASRVLPAREFDLRSLRVMDADVAMTIDELDFGTPALAPWRAVRTGVHLKNAVLRLRDFQATIAGGRVNGTVQLDGRDASPRVVADMKVAGLDVAGWVRGLHKGGAAAAPASTAAQRSERTAARQGAGPPTSYLSGVLGGTARLRGHGRSTAAIVGTLDGQVRLELRDGTLSHLATELIGLDVAQALGVMVRGDRALPLRCAVLDVGLAKGVATTRVGVLDNRDSTVYVSGSVDLGDETMALTLKARPKDTSLLSLRSPVKVSGGLADPQVSVISPSLVGRVAAAIALGAVAPPAALLPLVEVGKKPSVDPCDTPSAPSR